MRDFARLKNISDSVLSACLENTPFLRFSLGDILDDCDETGVGSHETTCSEYVVGRRDPSLLDRASDELSSIGSSAKFRPVSRVFIDEFASSPERETPTKTCGLKQPTQVHPTLKAIVHIMTKLDHASSSESWTSRSTC